MRRKGKGGRRKEEKKKGKEKKEGEERREKELVGEWVSRRGGIGVLGTWRGKVTGERERERERDKKLIFVIECDPTVTI